MLAISYLGQPVATTTRERFFLSPVVAELDERDPLRRMVELMVLYARDVITEQLPGPYSTLGAERYARTAMMPAADFRAHAGRGNNWLAEHFNAPLEQVVARRLDADAGALA